MQNTIALRAMSSLTQLQQHPSLADLRMEELQQATQSDDAYTHLLERVRHGFPRSRYDLHSIFLPYWKLQEDLYCDGTLLLYGPRVVISATLRKTVLTRLHDSHRGAEATKHRAKESSGLA